VTDDLPVIADVPVLVAALRAVLSVSRVEPPRRGWTLTETQCEGYREAMRVVRDAITAAMDPS
jgi:hypothetical protein